MEQAKTEELGAEILTLVRGAGACCVRGMVTMALRQVNKVDTLEGRLAATAESAEATVSSVWLCLALHCLTLTCAWQESQDSEEKLRQLEREIEFQSEK